MRHFFLRQQALETSPGPASHRPFLSVDRGKATTGNFSRDTVAAKDFVDVIALVCHKTLSASS